MLNNAACALACSCKSSMSSTLPSGLSCLRCTRRSALSRCFCWRVCSFWRLVNVDRPRGIPSLPISIVSYRQFLIVSLYGRPASRATRRIFPWLPREGVAEHAQPAKSSPAKLQQRNLPARLARLARVSLVIIASPSSSTTTAAKALSAAPAALGTIRLRFRFVDGQRAPPQLGSVQRRNGLFRLARIGHFHKPETARPPGFPVGDDAHFFHRSVSLEQSAQFCFGCAVG